MQNVDLNMKDK